MIFTSPIFLFYFLPVSLIAFRTLTLGGAQLGTLAKIALILFTYFFYGFESSAYLFPFLVATVMDYFWGRCLMRSHTPWVRRLIVSGSVFQNLALFFIFKYLNEFHTHFPNVQFFTSLHALFKDTQGVIPLPPGISFYLFESLSYVIDIYRNQIKSPRNPLNFLVFISMFPRFIAGPIVRFSDLNKHIVHYQCREWMSGIFVFCIGFIIKVLFADQFGEVTEALWGKDLILLGSLTALMCYTFQIYLDFSGYSLMAIGLGMAIGFPFIDNFREPYHATSISDFWRRWHISLSTWLRDYLYIPLGGSRAGKFRTHLNLFLTMVIGGIWHGASTNFALWGAWHGSLLILDKIMGEALGVFRKPLTFFLVMLGWLPFRAKGSAELLALGKGLLGRNGRGGGNVRELFLLNPAPVFFLLLGLGWVFILEPRVRALRENREWSVLSIHQVPSGVLLFVTAAFGLALMIVFSKSVVPFLYFQF